MQNKATIEIGGQVISLKRTNLIPNLFQHKSSGSGGKQRNSSITSTTNISVRKVSIGGNYGNVGEKDKAGSGNVPWTTRKNSITVQQRKSRCHTLTLTQTDVLFSVCLYGCVSVCLSVCLCACLSQLLVLPTSLCEALHYLI